MPKHVLVILAEGNEEVEAITQVDLLRRADIKVTVAGLSGTEVKGSHDIVVKADIPLDQFSGDFDAVVLPGGMPGTVYLYKSEIILSTVRETYNKGLLCAAICAAPLVLDTAGILEGKKFTCYPGIEEKINTGTFCEKEVVKDENIITSRGVGTAIPFALAIVEYLLGKERSEELASEIVFSIKL